MKTLVIHPKDSTTDFLSPIYEGRGWEVLRDNPSTSYMVDEIIEAERIVMMGHGSENGLFGFNRMVVDSRLVYLLRQKICVGIWCNADVFFRKYELKGFFTGMIISDADEAEMYCLHEATCTQITESNKLFSEAIAKNLHEDSIDFRSIQMFYHSEENPIICFNQKNLYER